MATLFIILIALAIGGVFIYLAKCSTPEYKGKMGEERVHNNRILSEILKKERFVDYGNIKRVSMQRLWVYHNWHKERPYLGHVWRNRNGKGSKKMP